MAEAGWPEQRALTNPVSGTGEHMTQPPATELDDNLENQGNGITMMRRQAQCGYGGSNTDDRNDEERNTCSVLLKEYITLVDYMNPEPILGLFMSDLEIDRPSSIRDIQEMTTTSEKNRKLVEYIRSRGPRAYTQFKDYLVQTRQEKIATLLDAAERNEDTGRIRNEIKETARQLRSTEFPLFLDFKADIIDFYRENESTISVSPLVDEHDVKLEEFYIQPPMFAANKPGLFGAGVNTEHSSQSQVGNFDDKVAVKHYKDLLISQDDNPYKHIYITSPAGMGKTSFAQHLAMTWCQAHKHEPSLSGKFREDDICTMQKFDMLFLLHLRDFQGTDICIIEDLIVDMVSKSLARSTLYTKQFLQQLIYEKRCVVVLDGLDEWQHPNNCKRKPQTPHNNHPTKCTVITTTRPWKLGTVGLSSKYIDRQVEISELDGETSRELIRRAIKLLNDKRRPNLPPKIIDEFYTTVSTERLGNILCTPYIHLQQVCLWFDDCHIGNSKCEFYGNIIDLILKRGLKRNEDLNAPASQVHPNSFALKNMNENKLCKQFFTLLISLGKLAFFALFHEIKEASLIIDREDILEYLDCSDIDMCLKLGLLSQLKDIGRVSEIRMKVSFSHKSIQEFFCALYLCSAWNAVEMKPIIEKACSSLPGILEMEEVFVFMSGIKPEVYAAISKDLENVVCNDSITQDFRTCSKDNSEIRNTLLSYQVMQMDCFTEKINNGYTDCDLHLQDIFLVGGQTEKNLSTLKEIVKCNVGNVKSVCVWYLEECMIKSFFEGLELSIFKCVETMIIQCDGNVWFIGKILKQMANTLKYLRILRPKLENRTLAWPTISSLSKMANLHDICIQEVEMSKKKLLWLFRFLASCTTLRRVTLEALECKSNLKLIFKRSNLLHHVHLDKVPVYYLDLSKMNLLRKLYLEKMHLRTCLLNTESLEECTINGHHFASQEISSVLAELPNIIRNTQI